MASLLRGGSELKKSVVGAGFALPTILISSVVMLIVLLVAVTSTTSVRTAIKDQYYQQLAQVAGEAGIAYAQACLDANDGVPQWSDANPLTPSTDCSGNQFPGTSTVKVLVVAGGGGGGTDMGGGGGGGGVVYNPSYPISKGSFPITVGAGGKGAPAGVGGAHPSVPGTNGGNSTFGTITAIGGGRGGMSHNTVGLSINTGAAGGSGGGASGYNSNGVAVLGGSGTAGQGYAGGNQGSAYYSGGGGGAGGAGASGNSTAHGGIGVSNSILGTAYYWGGGGGGGGYSIVGGNGGNGGGGGGAVGATTGGAGLNAGSAGGGGSTGAQTNTPGGNGGANTGGGGGGGSHYWTNNKGGDGGSGIVVISYPTGTLTATGGTITTNSGNTIHTFTGSGTFTITSDTNDICPEDVRCSVTSNENIRSGFRVGLPTIGSGAVKVLVVGGGGGGAKAGSGGGGGGYVYDPDYALSLGDTTVTVGDGGAGGTAACAGCPGTKGQDSVFGSITAEGGGYGVQHGNAASSSGGSGGGGAILTTGNIPSGGVGSQGNDGGVGFIQASWTGGSAGGGGAGTPGRPGGNVPGSGNGGEGKLNTISGFPVYYAGGGGGGEISGSYVGGSSVGGGGWSRIDAAGTNGTANTGGGGGGGSYNGTYFNGGNGGSGIVIVSYPTGSVTATGGTMTYPGSNTVHTFTNTGTVNFNVTAIDAKKTIPNSGYVEVLRNSNGSVWRTYTQPSAPAAVVPDQCSGQAKSIYGWNSASVVSGSTFTPQPLAKYISTSANPISAGAFYLRKDFTVTKPGTYVLTSAADDVGTIWLDDELVGSTGGTTLTQNVDLDSGCHTLLIKVVNDGVLPTYGNAALSLKKSGTSDPIVVTDQTWRAAAGGLVHYSSPKYYASPSGWTNATNVRLSTSGDANWAAQTGDVYARFITSPTELSGGASPSNKWTNFRDGRDITVASNTSVKVGVQCDDNCKVYLDGEVIIASAAWSADYTTTVTLTPGTHKFGVALYNASAGASGFSFAAVRVSDGVSLSVSDPSWLAANYWNAADQDPYSYDTSYLPNPDPVESATARVLVVGGGGGGGTNMGGGGGGGGVVYNAAYSLRTGVYSVKVGAGGAGAPAATGSHPTVPGSNGANSVFDSIVAIGGGRGGLSYNDIGLGIASGVPGGSGGGASGYNNNGAALGATKGGLGISGQGNSGGNQGVAYYSGGGGGAGGAGASGNNKANGGDGVQNDILGTSYYWGGGGGGSGYSIAGGNGGNGGGGGGAVGAPAGTGGTGGVNNGSAGTNGCTACAANVPGGNAGANTGGGGGGGSHYTANNKGGDGGSGIVVIAYLTGTVNATGGTITTSGGYTIHRFNSSGTFTVTSIP